MIFPWYIWVGISLALIYLARKKPRGRPTPSGYLLFQDLPGLIFNSHRILDAILEIYPLTGDTFYANADRPTITTRNADNIKYIFNDIDTFARMSQRKRMADRYTISLFGGGIFLANGDLWKIQRVFSSPLFRKNSLDRMISVFEKHGHVFLQMMDKFEEAGEVVDLQQYFNKYTMDTFGEIGFGLEFNSLTKHNEFAASFDRAQNRLVKAMTNPYYWYFDDKVFYDSIRFVNQYAEEVIRTRKECTKTYLEGKDDIISRFVSQQEENNFSDKFLSELLMNFVIAGKDTTAQLMTWMCYNLALYPDLHLKLVEEIDSFDEDFTRENVNSLEYLSAFLHETLRLYPSVPRTYRMTTKDVKLPDGIMIYKDEVATIDIFSLHRNPNYWDEPLEFNPDRWLGESPLKHPFQYLPFYGGPMVCLGKHLALAEAKTLIIMLLKKYSFSLTEEVTKEMTLILKCKTGLKVRLSKRK